MKNIDKIDCFEVSSQQTAVGLLTTLVAEYGVSAHGSIFCDKKTLLANYIYKPTGGYNLVYTVLDTLGNVESFVEDDGILPTLFLSPTSENHVSIVPYHPDKELEISLPIFERENIEIPNGNRPFTGKFIGTTQDYAIFYDINMFSHNKPDKLHTIAFKNGLIKKKKNIKIEPRDNKIFVANNEIHLLAKADTGWLHRQIDEKGELIRERIIESEQPFYREVISLSFVGNSYLLAEEKGVIYLDKIGADAKCEKIELFDLQDPFFNTWRPVQLGEETFILNFNTGFGNGWLTIKKGQLLEIFYSKGVQGYKNLLNNERLPMSDENVVLWNINKTAYNAYAIVFYPRVDRKIYNRRLMVLNRALK